MGDESAPAKAADVLLGGKEAVPANVRADIPDPFDEFARAKGTSCKGGGRAYVYVF